MDTLSRFKYGKTWGYTKKLLIVIIGSFVSALALNIFIIPHKFLSGGVSGIALIVQYLSGFQAGYFIILANIPLFILSIKYIDREFTILTIIGTVLQASFLVLTKNFSNYFIVEDLLLSCIYGGIIYGLAFGFIFSNHGSLGGADIICMILRKKYDVDLGKIVFKINLVIVSLGSIFLGLRTNLKIGLYTAMYTLVFMYISSFLLDRVIKGFDQRKLLFIITSKEKEITTWISSELGRSSTLLYGEGTYIKEKKQVIYCVVALDELPKIKGMIETVDPNAFISILDTAEVKGKGFKSVV
jgi:uncharacterized membrane-anchored protein YitT (DUF2179 family)